MNSIISSRENARETKELGEQQISSEPEGNLQTLSASSHCRAVQRHGDTSQQGWRGVPPSRPL
jgi:hypothetical protein